MVGKTNSKKLFSLTIWIGTIGGTEGCLFTLLLRAKISFLDKARANHQPRAECSISRLFAATIIFCQFSFFPRASFYCCVHDLQQPTVNDLNTESLPWQFGTEKWLLAFLERRVGSCAPVLQADDSVDFRRFRMLLETTTTVDLLCLLR